MQLMIDSINASKAVLFRGVLLVQPTNADYFTWSTKCSLETCGLAYPGSQCSVTMKVIAHKMKDHMKDTTVNCDVLYGELNNLSLA